MQKNKHISSSIFVIFSIIVIVIIAYSFFTNLINQDTPYDNLTVAQRIAPVGQVYLEGDIDITAVAKQASASNSKKRTGKEIYQESCSVCHAIGVADAPKFANKTDWAPRIKQGIKTLVATAIKGKGAMPPRGTCSSCSDEDINSAVTYMVNQSK